MQSLPRTLKFLNGLRHRVGLPHLTILPSLDHMVDMPRQRTHMQNPLHILFGLALHGRVTDWWLDAWDAGATTEIQFRYIVKRTGVRVVRVVPDDVWAELCQRYPVVCGFVYTDKSRQDNPWGLPKGKARPFPAKRQANQVPFDLLS
jgi:hypothetical protein